MTLVTKQDAAALSTEEKKRLGEIETRIRKGMANFLEVGRDLMIIRDEKLYREEFTSFEEYCRSRFEIDRTYAHRLIHSAEVMSSLSGGNNVAHGQHSETPGVDNSKLPENERQVRELTKAPEPHRQKIWDEAVRTAPDGKVTAKHIRKTVRANFKPAKQLGPRQTIRQWRDRADIGKACAAEVLAMKPAQIRDFIKHVNAGDDPRQALATVKQVKKTKDVDKAIQAKRDELGQEIPKDLQDVFGESFFETTITQLELLENTTKSMSRWCPYLLVTETTADINTLRHRFIAAKPYAVHTGCAGKGCEDCRQCGYVPEWRYKEMVHNGEWAQSTEEKKQ